MEYLDRLIAIIIALFLAFIFLCIAFNFSECGTLTVCNSNKVVSAYCADYTYVSDNIYKCDGKLLSCTDTACNVFLPDKKIKEKKVQIIEEEA